MPYQFVHAADIHLDSPLRSLALRDTETRGPDWHATRRAFANLVELCFNEQVDALLLARRATRGIFDGAPALGASASRRSVACRGGSQTLAGRCAPWMRWHLAPMFQWTPLPQP